MNFVGLLGWIASWFGLLYVLVVFLPPGFTFLFVVPLCYCSYRLVVQLCYFRPALRMRRIMLTYPWQVFRRIPYGLTNHPEVIGKHYGWFEFSNPARSQHRLPLVFPRHHRTEWWHRRMAPRAKPMLKAGIETIWFAGDPRFIGLIAAPDHRGIRPRRLHVLEQRMAMPEKKRCVEWGATAEDVERSRRVGIYPAQP
ncbi:hypothetical protein GCM10019016_027820 [Streptomyces prasinosporus]|uniref:Uncharacterized protein n=1 Tax=Streptomyces prasinosporus TaxID=68256 RepID=A0ABP6TKE1_9ACTN